MDTNSNNPFLRPYKYTVRFIPFNDNAGQNMTYSSVADEEKMDCDETIVSQAHCDLNMKKGPTKTITPTFPPAVPSPPPPPPSSAPALSPENIFEDYGLAHPPLSPPVTFHMIILNEIVLWKVDPGRELVRLGDYIIYQRDLADYQPGPKQWLPDNAVNFYLHMIQRRSRADTEKYAKVYAFPSFLYQILSVAKGIENVKQFADENIFNYELIFFPVCVRAHWRLVVADVKAKTISAYNSIESTPCLLIVKNIKRYLDQEYKKQFHVEKVPEWTLQPVVKTPQQCNADDCGVYALQFADYLSRRKPFDFNQSHMIYFRAKMLYESATGRLLPNLE